MKTTLPFTLVFILLIALPFSLDAQISAIWTTATTGTLNGVSFTVTSVGGPSTSTWDFDGPEFVSAPLTSSEPALDYQGESDWTITFASPISNLLLYARW